MELHRRKIKPGIFYAACGREETIIHRFWRCPHSRHYWKLLGDTVATPLAGLPEGIVAYSGMRAWVLDWLSRTGNEEREMVLRSWYELWLARNKARGTHQMEDPQLIVQRVLYLAEEWMSSKDTVIKQAVERGPDKWSKPDDGWVKVNSDGALGKHQGSGGGGAVLRNNHGEFIAGACHFSPLAADAETVELLVCRRAVILAQELNIQRVILERDSQVAVWKISSEQKDLYGNEQIVEELKTLLSTFSGFRIAWSV
ncbi:uncharacterized protein [Aegilops tauschii subsp. strangulata]|uniref:uncharacterized protein n=1 Tax=Aegilops tauschii subsp. strangulata TaxID=200361 RepID=UPI001ABBE865|nr:uncharacterized protein LOC109739293 [Aegilops tauschii subsp. strangulata]